jgi:RNA polymerase sigma factor (sigma-70 family)
MPSPVVTEEFEKLFLPHLDSAYNLARWLLRNDGEAEDVVHDSFLRAHRYYASFQGSDPRAWLLGIVRNACLDSLRTRRAHQFASEEDAILRSSSERSPERDVIVRQGLEALRACLDALPPEYREAIVLREMEELSYKDIAAVAGIALGTVMSRLNRARERLENCLTKKEVRP